MATSVNKVAELKFHISVPPEFVDEEWTVNDSNARDKISKIAGFNAKLSATDTVHKRQYQTAIRKIADFFHIPRSRESGHDIWHSTHTHDEAHSPNKQSERVEDSLMGRYMRINSLRINVKKKIADEWKDDRTVEITSKAQALEALQWLTTENRNKGGYPQIGKTCKAIKAHFHLSDLEYQGAVNKVWKRNKLPYWEAEEQKEPDDQKNGDPNASPVIPPPNTASQATKGTESTRPRQRLDVDAMQRRYKTLQTEHFTPRDPKFNDPTERRGDGQSDWERHASQATQGDSGGPPVHKAYQAVYGDDFMDGQLFKDQQHDYNQYRDIQYGIIGYDGQNIHSLSHQSQGYQPFHDPSISMILFAIFAIIAVFGGVGIGYLFAKFKERSSIIIKPRSDGYKLSYDQNDEDDVDDAV